MNTAIILAAGESTRSESGSNKILLEVLAKPILSYSLDQFEKHCQIGRIVVVVRPEDKKKVEEIIKRFKYKKIKKIVTGGKTRQGSVYLGVNAFRNFKRGDLIVIHNAANPLVTDKEITKTIMIAKKCGAAAVGSAIKETVKLVKGNQVKRTLNRDELFTVQTPQVIEYSRLKKGFAKAQKIHFEGTDDLSLVELIGVKPQIVKSSKYNFKITTPLDVEVFRSLLGETPQEFRGGIGEDSHKFVRSKKDKGLYLAGTCFEEYPRFDAHSDGDIALHALCNAIASAIGESSLSNYADKMCKEAKITDSREYLKVILDKMSKKKYKVTSIALSFEGSQPEIDALSPQLKNSLAKLLNLEKPQIGITATSGEGLTDFGKGKGMKCTALVNLIKG